LQGACQFDTPQRACGKISGLKESRFVIKAKHLIRTSFEILPDCIKKMDDLQEQ